MKRRTATSRRMKAGGYLGAEQSDGYQPTAIMTRDDYSTGGKHGINGLLAIA